MAKRKTPKNNSENSIDNKDKKFFSLDNIIPVKFQTAALLAIILIMFFANYSPIYFGGKTFQSGDIVTSKSLSSYVEQEREDYTLWYPYIFCGMPAYGLATDYKWFNVIWVGMTTVRDAFMIPFSVDYAKWSFYLILLGINMFFLVNYLTKNKLIALFGGLSTSFSTGIVLFLLIGHVTKLTALAFFPLIYLMILKLKEKPKLRDFALLTIAIQMSFQGWHVQIIYYTILSIGIFFLYNIIRSQVIKQKDEVVKYFKTGIMYAVALVIAILIQSDNLTQIYEYNPYSTRGTESILDKQKAKPKESDDSEYYNYHTNWSFSPQEVLTFIVPSYYGFGNSTYKGELSKNQEVEVNTYFGQMMTVDVAMYMGVVVFFLGLFAIYADWRNPYVQFLALLSAFSLLISFGRTFSLVFDPMFYYFPYFSKFRVPSMILVLMQLSFPILASIGLKKILDLRETKNKSQEKILFYAAVSFTVLFIIVLIGNQALAASFKERVMNYAASIRTASSQRAGMYNALSDYMAKMFTNDLMVAFGALAATFWLVNAYLKRKLGKDIMLVVVIAIVMFDLLRIDNRGAKYQNDQNVDNLFVAPDYVKVLKEKQDDQPYRMLNLKQDGSMGSFRANQNFNAYFYMQDFYGYTSIKPRSYQDYLDVVGIFNQTMWNMLNVKYLVIDKALPVPGMKEIYRNDKTFIYENTNVKPRAYFVDSVAIKENYQFLLDVKNQKFDPEKVAFVHGDEKFDIDKPDSTAYVTFKEYKDEKMIIEANASGNNLLFLGDTYFPKGWTATIDGAETEIYKLNHGFRGIVVPAGKHNIVFKYLPQSFVISKYLALIFSTGMIGLLIFGIFLDIRKKRIG